RGGAWGKMAARRGEGREKERQADERERVGGFHSEEQGSQRTGQSKRDGQANRQADDGAGHAAAQHHAQNVGGLRTEGHANANFVGPLADRIGHYAKYTDRGEDQSDGPEDGHHGGDIGDADDGFGDEAVHGFDVVQ